MDIRANIDTGEDVDRVESKRIAHCIYPLPVKFRKEPDLGRRLTDEQIGDKFRDSFPSQVY